jgi:hypothetical protein
MIHEENDELYNLIRKNNIINYSKTKRLSCFGHVHRMTEDRMVKKMTSGNRYLKDWQKDQKLDDKTIYIRMFKNI